jgi:hypothetical protein
MRATVGILGGISVLFVGFYGLQEQASQTQDAAVTNGTNASASAYNTTTEVFGGLGQAAGPGVVWMGIAAVILIALGFLVVAGNSGR